jgi:hypothetical protein
MKTTLSLLLLFVGLGSFAGRIDPAYSNGRVYDVEIDAAAAGEALYNEKIDDPAVVQVMVAGSVPCTRNVPIGVRAFATAGSSPAIRTRVGLSLDHFITSDRDGTLQI